MHEEIIDRFEPVSPDNGKQLRSIFLIALVSFALLIAVDALSSYVPPTITILGNVRSIFIGASILCIVYLNGKLIPKYLNQMHPAIHEVLIAGITGFIVFSIEMIYKLFQNDAISAHAEAVSLRQMAQFSAILGFIGLFIAYSSVRKLRNKPTYLSNQHIFMLLGIAGLLMKFGSCQ